MTEAAQETRNARPDAARMRERYNLHSGRNIIPGESVSGQALAIVVAIMAFLACMTVGGVSIIAETSAKWQSDVAREITVQIRPSDAVNMEDAARRASRLVLQFDGIEKVTALDDDASAELLAPWLGTGFSLEELPVPRLLTVSVREGAAPDLEAIAQRLRAEVPSASLDNHRAWLERLNRMALVMVTGGMMILALVLAAAVLIVVFATRGAMSGNKDIIDVLHFVGADARFIAREFERHFLVLALKGAAIGGASAAALFAALTLWFYVNRTSPQADQMSALFGNFTIPLTGYAGILIVVGAIAALATLTSRFVVLRHVGSLEDYRRTPR